MKAGLIYLYVGLALWSTSALVVVNFRGLLPPLQSASVVIAVATIFVFAFLFATKRDAIRDIFRCRAKDLVLLCVTGFFGVFLYPICYFKGLHSAQPLEANVINYFWPLLATSLGFVMVTEQVSMKKITGVILGMTGAIITTSAIQGYGDVRQATFSTDHISTYAWASLGAFSYGAFSVMVKKFKVNLRRGTPLRPESAFAAYLLVSSILHLVVNIRYLSSPIPGFDQCQFSPAGMVSILAYSLLNFSVAYFCWTRAVSTLPLSVVTVPAYLVPVVSTMLLALVKGMTVTVSTIYGLSFILVGLYVSQDHRRYITPFVGMWLGVIVFGSLVVLLPATPDNAAQSTYLVALLEVMVAVFAILCGFLLNRAVDTYNRERAQFTAMDTSIARLCERFPTNKKLGQSAYELMAYLHDVNCEFGPMSPRKQLEFSEEWRVRLAALKSHARGRNVTQDDTDRFDRQIWELEDHVSAWKQSRSECISPFEWCILSTMVIALVAIVYSVRDHSVPFEIFTVVFSSTIVLCLMAIRDYDLRRPRRALETVMNSQALATVVALPKYVPREIAEAGSFSRKLLGRVAQDIRTRDQRGDFCDRTIHPAIDTHGFAIIALAVLGVLAVIYSIIRLG